MSSFEAVPDDEVEKEVQAAALSKPARRSKAKLDTSHRTVMVWFSLQHSYGVCENPNCVDERPLAPGRDTRTAMRADIDGTMICRYCFLSGYGK